MKLPTPNSDKWRVASDVKKSAARPGVSCHAFRVTRHVAAFTLAEVLAAMLFLAIVIPTAVEALHVSSLAGEVAARKGAAARIADRILNESLVLTNWSSGQRNGTASEGALDFNWTLTTETWPPEPSTHADGGSDISGAGQALHGEVEHAGGCADAERTAAAGTVKHEFALMKIERTFSMTNDECRMVNSSFVIRHSSFSSAFTLIEMVLAIGVAAIVLIAINAVLFAALRLREATADTVDTASPIDQAATFIRRDLQCVVTPTNGTSKVLSGDFRAGSVSSVGVADPVAIEMFTATGALGQNAPWADIQRVTYELKQPSDRSAIGQDLYRSVARNLLTMTTPEVDDQLMLSGVANIKFSCFDGSQWQDAWDTTSLNSVNTNLPLAVRVDIQMVGHNNNDTLAPD